MTTFEQAFAIVIGHEGAFSAEREDPGNWTGGAVGNGALKGTKYGISAAAYPEINIADLSLADAQAFYRRDYWNHVHGDELPPPLALLVFDSAVNNGPGRAIRWLQTASGTSPDGIFGPATLDAVKAAEGNGPAALCGEFQALRMNFMANLPTWSSFGLGWARRLCSLPYQSMTMTS